MLSLLLRFWLVFSITTVMSLTACTSGRAHENFTSHMNYDIGKSIDDPEIRLNRYSDLRGEKLYLKSGNIEIPYLFGPSCYVYFEIDKASRKIISWRHRGNDIDCAVVP